MGLLNNVNYKKLECTRPDGIKITILVDLKDPLDLDENFLVLSIEGKDNPKENKLFYWINKKRWTINELNYFALNNQICIRILDKQGNELTSYGNCNTQQRVFNQVFGINFN